MMLNGLFYMLFDQRLEKSSELELSCQGFDFNVYKEKTTNTAENVSNVSGQASE